MSSTKRYTHIYKVITKFISFVNSFYIWYVSESNTVCKYDAICAISHAAKIV